eukprot:659968-Amphidinium_carterae.10
MLKRTARGTMRRCNAKQSRGAKPVNLKATLCESRIGDAEKKNERTKKLQKVPSKLGKKEAMMRRVVRESEEIQEKALAEA